MDVVVVLIIVGLLGFIAWNVYTGRQAEMPSLIENDPEYVLQGWDLAFFEAAQAKFAKVHAEIDGIEHFYIVDKRSLARLFEVSEDGHIIPIAHEVSRKAN